MSYGHPWRSMTAGPPGGPASAYPTLSTPASICFSAPNGLCVPAVIVVPFAVFIVVAEPIVVSRLGRRRPGRGRDEVGHRLHRRCGLEHSRCRIPACSLQGSDSTADEFRLAEADERLHPRDARPDGVRTPPMGSPYR